MSPHPCNEQTDRWTIRELLENWVVWRDAGDWDRFRTVWHEDGRMMATWFQGSGDEFIKVSREGFERGVRILHFLGGISIDLAGPRAVSQTLGNGIITIAPILCGVAVLKHTRWRIYWKLIWAGAAIAIAALAWNNFVGPPQAIANLNTTLTKLQPFARNLAFTADGNQLATVNANTTAYLLDCAD